MHREKYRQRQPMSRNLYEQQNQLLLQGQYKYDDQKKLHLPHRPIHPIHLLQLHQTDERSQPPSQSKLRFLRKAGENRRSLQKRNLSRYSSCKFRKYLRGQGEERFQVLHNLILLHILQHPEPCNATKQRQHTDEHLLKPAK